MTRWLAGLLGLILVASVSLWAFRASIGLAIMTQAAEHFAGREISKDIPDGLSVILCGSGSPVPDPDRAGPCSLVIAGKQMFVVDAGEGASRNLGRLGIPAHKLDAVLVTHFHSDHIDGLGALMTARWGAGSSNTPLPIVGPTGVEIVVAGLNMAYSLDQSYRTAHLGKKLAPPQGAGGRPVSFKADTRTVTVWDRDGLRISAFSVDHEPVEPAVGYRFDYKGRSVVFSGDTAPSQSLVVAARGADLLVHEALQPELVQKMASALEKKHLRSSATIMRKVLPYHSSAAQAADAARVAGVHYLVLNHIGPPIPSRYFNSAFLGDASKRFDGPIVVGEDGMMFYLAPGRSDIAFKRLL